MTGPLQILWSLGLAGHVADADSGISNRGGADVSGVI